MEDCFCIEIIVYVAIWVLGGMVFVFGDEYSFVDDNCLGFHFPPRIDYQFMETLHFLVDDLIGGHCDLSEKLGDYFCAIYTSAWDWAA